MMRLVPSLLVAGSVLAVASAVRAQAPSLPPAPVPIGAYGPSQNAASFQNAPSPTSSNPNYAPPPTYGGDSFRTAPPLPATAPYDGPPPTRLGPPPDPAMTGQPPFSRLGPPPDPALGPPPGPPPFMTSEQAAERERIFFLSWNERPGWFLGLETSIVGPHVMNRLYQNVNRNDGVTDFIHLPGADLGGTVSPRFDVGYRFGEDWGGLVFSYRFLLAEGRLRYVDDFDMPVGTLNSRLDLQTFDFDYATRDFLLGAHWEMRARVGARIGYAYFDSTEGDVFAPNDPTRPLLFVSTRTSNRFVGAGPHALVEFEHRFRSRSVSPFARVEGSLLFGKVQQGFSETLVQGPDSAFGSVSPSSTQAVPVLQTEVGLRWRPTWHDNWSFAAGYTYEQWWGLGNAGGSKAEIWSQGCFLRGEVMF